MSNFPENDAWRCFLEVLIPRRIGHSAVQTFRDRVNTGNVENSSSSSFLELVESNRWVEHTYEVVAKARLLEKQILDLETGVRGFAITGDALFLEPYYLAEARWDDQIAFLSDLVSDNPSQVAAVLSIHETKLEWMRRAANPTIRQMTQAAITVLSADKQAPGFVLMVEAGDVDWANHDNNIDNSIGALNSGDAAVRAIIKWVEANSNWDESLMIVTADHGHYFHLTSPAALLGGQ